jgi:hypothetical protein
MEKREAKERGRRWLFAPKGNETSHRSKIPVEEGWAMMDSRKSTMTMR